ncbi:MAG: MBL fold metallo-hydrolase [Bacillota bacterium]|nr:MBL fold metallo-hydrolase [Bacillota bacterium]
MELYAIRYAKNFAYVNNKADDSGEKESDFIFLYYLAKYNGRVILFDTGFRDEEAAAGMGITLIDVKDEVRHILVDPSCVDTIFITHSHFDHIGNLDLYDKASVIIPKQEYDIAFKEGSAAVKARLVAGDVVLVEDHYLFEDKFRFQVIGGHTPGSSVIYFEEYNKSYVIAGDECYSCDNIFSNVPNDYCADHQKNAEFIADAHNRNLIPLPYHDNKIILNYDRVSENISRII